MAPDHLQPIATDLAEVNRRRPRVWRRRTRPGRERVPRDRQNVLRCSFRSAPTRPFMLPQGSWRRSVEWVTDPKSAAVCYLDFDKTDVATYLVLLPNDQQRRRRTCRMIKA